MACEKHDCPCPVKSPCDCKCLGEVCVCDRVCPNCACKMPCDGCL